MPEFIMGVGITLLLVLLLGAGIRWVWKMLFPTKEEEDPEYLEHYTTDGRLREEVFPNSEGK